MSRRLARRLVRTRRRINGAALRLVALGLLVLFSCDTPTADAPRVAEPVSSRFSPAHTIELRANSGVLLEPQFLLQAAPDELLAIEKGTQDLWSLPLETRQKPRYIGSLRGRGRTRIIGAAATAGRLAMLDLAGNLWLYKAGEADALARWRVHAPAGTGPIALLATADSTWLIAEQRSSVRASDHTMRDSAIVVAVSQEGIRRTVWAFERAGPARPGAFFSDYVSANSFGDTVVVTAADPARIVTWSRGDTVSRRETRLRLVPTRRMSQLDHAALAKAAGSINTPLTREAVLRDFYPPISGARPEGAGWFVVAGAGSKNFALDYYCRGTFEETLLESPSISKITLLRDAVAVVREDLDRERVLIEYYPYSLFARSCR